MDDFFILIGPIFCGCEYCMTHIVDEESKKTVSDKILSVLIGSI